MTSSCARWTPNPHTVPNKVIDALKLASVPLWHTPQNTSRTRKKEPTAPPVFKELDIDQQVLLVRSPSCRLVSDGPTKTV
ncbi:hypothetical protein JTE90_008968 [Oedothorax gibbosus]|uniref:Uncharacterized protein n=1 Tax=Oedothorax gibbosus TaxID=931172 RepID=A0AAV6TL73_9ARAC|nr:hypothetical protein JTE90_008968 [Oedothorax gibbosus]